MEIKDYISRARRRLWIVVVVPLVAAVAAVLLAGEQPVRYVATATVVVTPPAFVNPTPQIVNQAVEDFRGAVDSAALIERVAQEANVDSREIADGLSSFRERASLIVAIQYVDEHAELARQVVAIAGRAGLEILAEAGVSRAEALETEAAALFAETDQDLQEMLEAGSLGSPAEEYRTLISKISELELRLVEREIEGSTLATQRIRSELDADRAKADQLRSSLAEYDTLSLLRNQGAAALEDARGALRVARATSASIDDSLVLGPTPAVALSSVPTLVERAIVVGGVAAVLAIAFVLILEWISPAPQRRVREGTAVDEDTADYARLLR